MTVLTTTCPAYQCDGTGWRRFESLAGVPRVTRCACWRRAHPVAPPPTRKTKKTAPRPRPVRDGRAAAAGLSD